MVSLTGTATSGELKRSRDSDGELVECKRRRLNPKELSLTVSILPLAHSGEIGNNRIYLSTKNFKYLFPATRDGEKCYLSAASQIYETVENPSLTDTVLAVDAVQYRNFHNHSIVNPKEILFTVNPNDKVADLPELSHVAFELYEWDNLYAEGFKRTPFHLDVKQLGQVIRDTFKGQPLRIGQKLLIKLPEGELVATVRRINHKAQSLDDPTHKKSVSPYNKIAEETCIDFISESEAFILSREIDSEAVKQISVTVTKVEEIGSNQISMFGQSILEAWKRGARPVPLTISKQVFCDCIKEKLQGKSLAVGFSESFEHDKNWSLSYSITEVDLGDHNSHFSAHSEEEYEKNYKKTFRLLDKHEISIKKSSHVILTTSNEQSRPAKKATFVILEKKDDVESGSGKKNWVSIEELNAFILEHAKNHVNGGRFVASLPSGKFLLQLESIFGVPEEMDICSGDLESLWEITKETNIHFRRAENTEIHLVDSIKEIPLKKVSVKVDIKRSKPAEIRCGGSPSSPQKVILREEELHAIFRDQRPKTLLDGHSFTAKTIKGEEIALEVAEVDFEGKVGRGFVYGNLYQFTGDTKVEFTSEKDSNVVLFALPEEVEVGTMQERLKKEGIAGLSEDVLSFLYRLIIARRKYADSYAECGILQERGAIFYGPPGTGKTIVARALGKLLGARGSCIKLVSSTELLKKYVGDTPRAIRALFQDPRDVASALLPGEKSPLFLIVFDEFDAIAGKDFEKSWERAAVNTLLSETDGLGGQDGSSLSNVFFIGLTNDLSHIYEAVKRPGRFATHLEFGLPNSVGRREIIETKMLKLKQNNRFDGNYGAIVDWLVERSVGKTGAFLEGLISKAFSYVSLRLLHKNVSQEDASNHQDGKLTIEDFKRALQDLLKNSGVEKKNYGYNFGVFQEPSYDNIAGQLANLGVAGLSDDVVDALQNIMLSRMKYKNAALESEYSSPKGLLLYGPRGVGKNTLVKALPKLFCMDSTRYQSYWVSELFPDFPSNLKGKLKEILKPSRQAAKDLGEESPLFVISIMGIDRLYKGVQGKDASKMKFQMKDFFAEINNLLDDESQEQKTVNNLLVIATMSTDDDLSSDYASCNQFGVCVKMNPPDKKGRKAIFEYYLRKCRLSQCVNFDRLVDLTANQNQTGEFIQSVVKKASSYPLQRAYKIGIESDKFLESDETKLKMTDLEKAIHEMKTGFNGKAMPGIYT